MARSELARKAAVTEASISRYLSSKAEPRSSELHRMAVALGTTMDWLFANHDDEAAPRVNEAARDYRTAIRTEPGEGGLIAATKLYEDSHAGGALQRAQPQTARPFVLLNEIRTEIYDCMPDGATPSRRLLALIAEVEQVILAIAEERAASTNGPA